MKKNSTLNRISAFAFSMLPFGIVLENKLWLGLIIIATILPLLFLVGKAVTNNRKEKTSFLSNLFGYNYKFIDILIACLGIANCLIVGLHTLSIIWVVSLCCIFVDLYFKRNRKEAYVKPDANNK